MPVPVPRTSKLVAHPVIKKNKSGGLQANPFQNLTRTLPVSPTGPPPSYGTREQWIESLPTWRRQKPRRIWEDDNTSQVQQPAAQDFSQGLAVAANAPVIKGERAQACIPPLCTVLDLPRPLIPKVVSANDGEADDEMQLDLPQWKWETCMDYAVESLPQEFGAPNPSPASVHTDVSIPAAHPYERGAFSPVFEDESPGFGSGLEGAPSPMEPVTPFCDFIDRAVAGSKQSGGMDFNVAENAMPKARVPCVQDFQSVGAGQIVEQPKQPAQAPVSSSSAAPYKKLAEPLAEWMASYVWKVCTTGYNLPPNYVNPTSIPIARFLDPPPRSLASSIHSVLLSTNLHPSAVFLALWYIVRLPVYCGSITLGPEHVKEQHFRTALFGDTRSTTSDSILQLSPMDESVPFRLVLVGCMLANKWLDDHTFSNKTWHSISNVPIHLLNELEILALDLFSYNLSVPHDKWSDWMEHIRSHHLSSIPPSHVQPISRPSSNPHLIIRKAIEDIIHTRLVVYPFPQPAFLGLEQRKKEKMENEKAMDDINLDEDGPLREEYLPRRRTNGFIGKVGFSSTNSVTQHNLPPPAKWSPAGDEPIFRDRQRTSGNYVAVQAPGMTVFPAWPVSYSDSNYQDQTWISHGNATEAKLSTGYGYEVANHHLAAFLPYPYPHAIPMIHMRTHSLSHDNTQIRGHIRTFSQNCFNYRPNNVHMGGALDVAAGDESVHWFAANSHAYAVPAYAYHSSVMHQPAWIQT